MGAPDIFGGIVVTVQVIQIALPLNKGAMEIHYTFSYLEMSMVGTGY
jgi:hypothetical protein